MKNEYQNGEDDTIDQPLVTFAIIAYNQEDYIREAVEGAFSQTYNPLEIIISDDCSTDATYDIICEMAQTYQGRHTVRTHRPVENLGIGNHVNKIGELAQGDFVLLNGGDDISNPDRSSILVKTWLDSGRKACSIYSNMSIIDKHSKVLKPRHNANKNGIHPQSLDEVVSGDTAGVYGCTQGVDSRVFSMFEPMKKEVMQEDEILPFRGLLLGGIQYLHQPLVQYRWHDSNAWDRNLKFNNIRDAKEWHKKRLKQKLAQRETWCKDLATFQDKNDEPPALPALTGKFEELVVSKQLELEMCSQNILLALLSTFRLMLMATGVRRSWKIFLRAQIRPWFNVIHGKLQRN